MAELKWLPEALQDIERLYSFLYSKSPDAAAQAARAILKASKVLQANPRIGRPMPDDETERRELFAAYGAGAYVIRYRLVSGSPVVIRVWHSRENRV